MKVPNLVIFAALALAVMQVHAAITVPGANNSDGALEITADTVIDLSQAVTAAWDADNSANAGKGVYDPSKWAVVFKYSSVNIAAGKTLTFKNHATRAPVVWLVSGTVNIAGTISLDGQSARTTPVLAEPGPGGFRGGMSNFGTGAGASAGFGPGGGSRKRNDAGFGGAYGLAVEEIAAYGNPSLVPLIGGSGGSGDVNWLSGALGGGAGGGAILIACSNSISVSGTLRANGGSGTNNQGYEIHTGGGSGGGIRLVCNDLQGSGVIQALGGGGWSGGQIGRIRIERVNSSSNSTPVPDPSVVPLGPSDTALLWPPAGSPEVKILSIGEQNVPADPLASFGTHGADAVIPQASTTEVIVETTNVEQASQVKVRVTPRSNANYTEVSASVDTVVSTTPLVLKWKATLPVQVGYSAVQVKVVRP